MVAHPALYPTIDWHAIVLQFLLHRARRLVDNEIGFTLPFSKLRRKTYIEEIFVPCRFFLQWSAELAGGPLSESRIAVWNCGTAHHRKRNAPLGRGRKEGQTSSKVPELLVIWLARGWEGTEHRWWADGAVSFAALNWRKMACENSISLAECPHTKRGRNRIRQDGLEPVR